MARWLSRRRLMGGILGIVAAPAGRTPANADGASTLDFCYWRNEMVATCSGDTRYEKWCFICNDPGTGWTTYKCEWRPNGPC